jgi:5-methylcytosine-specific restriction endonuclease McrA
MPFADPETRKRYHREYNKRWYFENKDTKKPRDRENYRANRERYLATNRAWEMANKDSVRERKKLYYIENRERILAGCQKYSDANREAKRKRSRDYAKANRDKYNSVKHNRRALEAKAEGTHTGEEWRALVEAHDHRCLRCGKMEPHIKLHRDHVIPITRGGSNWISNIQPLCATCNKWKGARLIIDFRPSHSSPRMMSLRASAYQDGPAEELKIMLPLTADSASL